MQRPDQVLSFWSGQQTSRSKKTPLYQNSRINISNTSLQMTTALLPDCMVYQNIIKSISLSDLEYQHVTYTLTNEPNS